MNGTKWPFCADVLTRPLTAPILTLPGHGFRSMLTVAKNLADAVVVRTPHTTIGD